MAGSALLIVMLCSGSRTSHISKSLEPHSPHCLSHHSQKVFTSRCWIFLSFSDSWFFSAWMSGAEFTGCLGSSVLITCEHRTEISNTTDLLTWWSFFMSKHMPESELLKWVRVGDLIMLWISCFFVKLACREAKLDSTSFVTNFRFISLLTRMRIYPNKISSRLKKKIPSDPKDQCQASKLYHPANIG